MLYAGEVNVALFPATSVTVTCAVTPAPVSVIGSGFGVSLAATPDVASEASKATATGAMRQPLASAAGMASPNVRVGGVASRLMVTEREAVPPGEVAVQVSVVPTVSVVIDVAPQPSLETSEAASSIVQVTCTSPRYQPALPAVPVTDAVITGAERSMFTTGDVKVAALPAKSVTVTCCVRPAPSWLKVSGLPLLVENTPDPHASAVVNGMLTSPLFQPLAPGAGLIAPKVSVGGVTSRLILIRCSDTPPPED